MTPSQAVLVISAAGIVAIVATIALAWWGDKKGWP